MYVCKCSANARVVKTLEPAATPIERSGVRKLMGAVWFSSARPGRSLATRKSKHVCRQRRRFHEPRKRVRDAVQTAGGRCDKKTSSELCASVLIIRTMCAMTCSFRMTNVCGGGGCCCTSSCASCCMLQMSVATTCQTRRSD